MSGMRVAVLGDVADGHHVAAVLELSFRWGDGAVGTRPTMQWLTVMRRAGRRTAALGANRNDTRSSQARAG